jgi:hypothetical protein
MELSADNLALSPLKFTNEHPIMISAIDLAAQKPNLLRGQQ